MARTRQVRTIRWGILGAGAIAGRFARDLGYVAGTRLAAVYARRPEAALAIADAHGGGAVSSASELFAAGIDAVYVATLPDTHHAFARMALEAGVPVLCEKPVTRSAAELEDLLALAAARGLLFMEAMKTPFLPLYRNLRELLVPSVAGEGNDGAIGPIQFVLAGNAALHTPVGHPSWSPTLAGGALLSIGVYQAFLAVDFLGPAGEVQALARMGSPDEGSGRKSDASVDAFSMVQCHHEAGFSQIYAGLELGSPGTATLSGPDGFAVIDKPWWNPTRATITHRTQPAVDLHYPIAGDGLHFEIAHFCDLLRTGVRESPIVSHAHSRAVIEMLDRARSAIGLRFPGEAPVVGG